MTSAGRLANTQASVPAAEACVWIRLFSSIVPPPSSRSTAMEMTAAGMDVATVSPIRRPR